MSDQYDPEIVKWYTRARRFPQLIGKTTDGTKIPGGPYTYTQVGAGVAVLIIALKTTWLWGSFGTIGNGLAALGLAYTVTLVVGKLPIGSRNPLAIFAGAVAAYTSPPTGKYAGRRVVITRPHLVMAGRPTKARRSSPADAPASEQIPAVVAPLAVTQPPSPTQLPTLTGVQQLLALTQPEEAPR